MRTPPPLLVIAICLCTTMPVDAASPPAGVADLLAAGRPQDLIVEFDNRAVEREVSELRQQRGWQHDRTEAIRLRQDRYRRMKDDLRATLPAAEHEVIAEYSAMPLTLIRLRTPATLAAVTRHRNVVGIYRDMVKYPVPDKVPQLDNPSKALVGQPVAAAAGLTGAGTTVVMVDSGANYTVADLGSCTAAATPASCRVSHALYVNASNKVVADTNPVASTANNHGTNVAAVVAGVASQTRVAVINVFGSSGTTSDSKILAAINWSILNQAAYNIRAINLSLGDGLSHTATCGSGNPYLSAFSNALAAGIVPVAASGNEAYTNGINSPACTPGAVSVGAVYVANYGGVGWTSCTDATTAADKVTCFSNSAPFLSVLAPGAIITAGGLSYGGTSQATPFVAATMALLANNYPDQTTSQWVAHLTNEARPVTDIRNSIISPRLDLAAISDAALAAGGDVPTLPEWAALCLGGLLLLGAVRQRRSVRPPAPADFRSLPRQQ